MGIKHRCLGVVQVLKPVEKAYEVLLTLVFNPQIEFVDFPVVEPKLALAQCGKAFLQEVFAHRGVALLHKADAKSVGIVVVYGHHIGVRAAQYGPWPHYAGFWPGAQVLVFLRFFVLFTRLRALPFGRGRCII